MKTLVTGATGFVGSAVVRHLVADGHDVRALVRPGSDRQNLSSVGVTLAEGDLLDPTSLAAAMAGCDGLFHVAADYRLWARDPGEIFRSNVDGTRNVLLAARVAGVARIVYTSSVAALGLGRDGAAGDETTPVDPGDLIGAYKTSKWRAQSLVLAMARDEGLPVVVVNPSTPVGPGDIKPTPTGALVLQAMRGQMRAYVDTALNIVHVDDVARGHLLAFDKGRVGECYILGSENLSLREILEVIAELTGGPRPRVRIPHGAVLPVAYGAELLAKFTGRTPLVTVAGVKLSRKQMRFRSDKARQQLGYDPRPARAALQDAVTWFHDRMGTAGSPTFTPNPVK